ncbi:hypothetical protein [Dethiobacter alkaliphilus]|uniref:hypothetical protein n=1 Tax=Dethiobacter alkaliphilus TaxID=427926 RepID=UPI002226C4FD|nr:hypothetical protein [Dethiobacter alkaliphilus]MCW3489548.1 hypothetical protein [Dethiobacter alkaliphilus]
MKLLNWRTYFILALLAVSALVYYIHYLIFRDVHHIFLYLIGDIAFVFIQVLLVTLILQKLLEEREKNALLKKLNMVIGAFFSEAGTSILQMLSSFDRGACQIADQLLLDDTWTAADFDRVCRQLDKATYQFHCTRKELEELRSFLLKKRDFLLRLLENPNLLEHDEFTELLWAVFHLTEELAARGDLTSVPDSDFEHLLGDVNRVYSALTRQWLSYMEHLRSDYPFLFSFAMRTNPFNPDASVEVTK